MSAPFIQAPTLAEYLTWLQNEHGFSHRSGHEGQISFERIMNSNETVSYDIYMSQDERLTPTTVYRLDTMLGVDSPFGKTPT